MPKIKSVEIKWEYDESPDLSWLDCTAEDHYGKNGSNWDHVSDEVKARVIKKDGSLFATCERYAKEDQERLQAFYDGEWHATGCVAHATVSYPYGTAGAIRLKRFTSGGLWGIESDASKSHRNEIEADQLNELKEHLEQFGVDTTDFWEKYQEE